MQINQKKQTIKSYVAIAIFLVFWFVAFAYLIFEDKLTKVVPNFSWAYNQTFHQNWSFFSQPAIYNDKFVFLLKKDDKIIDSIDVLNELWKTKRSKWNYSRENVWDHIMFRQMRKLRCKLQEKKIISFSTNDSLAYCELLTKNNNAELLQNLEVFGKEMLAAKGIKTNDIQFKIILFTTYTKHFPSHKHPNGNVKEFETSWKYFNK